MATSSVSNPDPWLTNAFGGGYSTAGGAVRITPSTILTCGPVYQGCCIIAGDIASTPIGVFRLDRAGDKVVKHLDETHPVNRLLNEAPNERMTAQQYRETIVFYALLWGNAFSLIGRDANGTPNALYPLRPDRIFAFTDTSVPDILPTIHYFYTTNQGQVIPLPESETLRISGLGDGQWGLSLFQIAGQSLGAQLASQTFANKYYENGIAPSGVVQKPSTETYVDAEQAKAALEFLRKQLRGSHEGLSKAMRVLMLTEGWEWKDSQINADQAQLVEVMDKVPARVANWLNMPPHMLGALQDSSVRANLEQQNKAFERYTLRRWKVKHQQEYCRKLLSARAQVRRTHVIEFVPDIAANMTFEDLVSAAGTGWRKWWSTNEIRTKFFHLNPDPDGDDLHEEAFAQSPEQAGMDSEASDDAQNGVENGNGNGQTNGQRLGSLIR